MYHGVTGKDHTNHFGRHLPAEQFEKHLIYFKKYFRILSLDELAASSTTRLSGSDKRPAIALTFDDGFENNLTCALPILEKHKVPATFFIPTFALNKPGQLLADLIDVTRAFTKEKELRFNGTLFRKKGPHRLLSPEGKNIYRELIDLSPAQLKKAFREFEGIYNTRALLSQTEPECYRLLNEAQVKELSSSTYVTLGSHTREHFALSRCTDSELEEELTSSKKELERISGKKITSLAFPYGDHDKRVIEKSEQAGYDTLLSAGKSEFSDVLPRVGITSAGSFAQNMLQIHKAFARFGF
jgi:peptidoglycan/xylan/chitin deacetylase (PgdA/CDA1 family)